MHNFQSTEHIDRIRMFRGAALSSHKIANIEKIAFSTIVLYNNLKEYARRRF
jgi:hypothetical protein